MSKLQFFYHPEMGEIRGLEIDGELWLAGTDVAEILGYIKPEAAVARYVDEADKRVALIQTPGSSYKSSVVMINEAGFYSLVASSTLSVARTLKRFAEAKIFRHVPETVWGDDDQPLNIEIVLPCAAAQVCTALRDAQDRERNAEAYSVISRQILADLHPVREYLDTILSTPEAVRTSRIAADYGLTTRRLNRILSDAGIQRSIAGRWALCDAYMGRGYTCSAADNIPAADIMPLLWSQKGRIMIHGVLLSEGILPIMDRRSRKSA